MTILDNEGSGTLLKNNSRAFDNSNLTFLASRNYVSCSEIDNFLDIETKQRNELREVLNTSMIK